MDLGIDLTRKNLLCAFDGQGRHLFTQGIACPLHCCTGLCLGSLSGLRNKLCSLCPGLIDQRGGLLFCRAPHIRGDILGLGELILHTALDRHQIRLGFVGCCKAVGNLFGTVIQGLHHRRPHKLHGEPGQDEEHHQLGN